MEDIDPLSFPPQLPSASPVPDSTPMSSDVICSSSVLPPSDSPFPSSSPSASPPLPQDALDIQRLLDSYQLEYDSNVVHQCLEFMHRYIKQVLDDANDYKMHAGRHRMGKQHISCGE